MMVKRKLDGAVDESSVDQQIYKSDATVHILGRIWRLTPSGTGSYGRQAVRPNLDEIQKFFANRSKYSILRSV